MATIISNGTLVEVLNLTLSASSDIQIGFTQPINRVIIKARTAVDIQVRTSPGAGNFFTVASGTSLTMDISGRIASDGTINPLNLWIRSVSATPIVEILGVYGG